MDDEFSIFVGKMVFDIRLVVSKLIERQLFESLLRKKSRFVLKNLEEFRLNFCVLISRIEELEKGSIKLFDFQQNFKISNFSRNI